MNYSLNAGYHETLDSKDTAPPPLPPWLRGFLVTAKHKTKMRLAGQEVEQLLNSKSFPHKELYARAEALLVPGCPGTVFVALRPDDTDAQGRQNVRLIAETLIQEIDRDYEEAEAFDQFTKTSTVPKAPHVARILPVERIAPETEIDQVALSVIGEHFPKIDSPEGTAKWASENGLPTFRVRYEEHSPAMHLSSVEIQRRVADLVPDDYAVDLRAPDETVLVVVAGGSVLMSVVRGYDAEEKFHHFRVGRKSTGSTPSSAVAPSRAVAA
jgi:tRNA(Ser,Leu) C12 N-acetylase TAN1